MYKSTPKPNLNPGRYPFIVNGQELLSRWDHLVALDVLQIAVDGKAVALPIAEEYDLQRRHDIVENRKYDHNEWVDLRCCPHFLAMPNGPARAC